MLLCSVLLEEKEGTRGYVPSVCLCVWSGWGRAHTRWEGLPHTAEFQWCLLALMECFSSVWLWHCPFWNLECLFRESLWKTAVQSCSTVALACQTYCRSEWGKHGGKHLHKELLTWGFDIPMTESCCLSIQSSSWFGWNMSLIISLFLKILWTLYICELILTPFGPVYSLYCFQRVNFLSCPLVVLKLLIHM